MDFDIHVWDVRRPYVPYASFSEHKDVATGKIYGVNSSHDFSSQVACIGIAIVTFLILVTFNWYLYLFILAI